MKKMKFTKSKKLFDKAFDLIPNQSQTLSKAPDQFPQGTSPIFSQKAKGAYTWDVDGNKFIDYLGAMGPIVLGYCYPTVDKAIVKQLKEGITFSQSHPLEIEVAELIKKHVPCAEMVRYGKNGADVTSAAIRIARAYTKREKIAFCGYHGAQDWYIVTTPRSIGIPKAFKKYSLGFPYNDVGALEKLFKKHKGEIAAVIMEPTDHSPPDKGYLQKIKKLAHKNGALIIYDEVKTGFRWDIGGAQKYYGVTPDICCLGKSIANGMPFSVVAGRKKIMSVTKDVFFSLSFGGECLSLAAAKATILEMEKKKVCKFLWKQGNKLLKAFRKSVRENGLEKYVNVTGSGPRFYIFGMDGKGNKSSMVQSIIQEQVIQRGVLFSCYISLTFAHSDAIIQKTINAFDKAFIHLGKAVKDGDLSKFLEGQPVGQPVFKKHS